MTRDDIIRMAREAGCLGPNAGGDPNGLWEPKGGENVTELMFCFAVLVAAAEREACAQVVDDFGDEWMCDSHMLSKIIRARNRL